MSGGGNSKNQMQQNDTTPTVISSEGSVGTLKIYKTVIQPGQKLPGVDGSFGDLVGFLQVIPKGFKASQKGAVWEITESNELQMADYLTIIQNNDAKGIAVGVQQQFKT